MNREGSIFFYFSNSQEALFDFFIKQIKQLHPFDPTWIAVPSLGVKNSLKNKIAQDLGISMGEKFFSMQPLVHQLIKTFFPGLNIHSHLNLALLIEKVIQQNLFNGSKNDIFQPLKNYLLDKNGDADFLRLTALSDHLSSLFVTYSLYGLNVQESLQGHWQGEIWKQVFNKSDYYFDPYSLLKMDPKHLDSKINLFIYNPPFMPKPYFLLLKKLNPFVNIHLIQFSPSCFFWSDMQTNFEKSSYLSKLKQKQISKEEIKLLETYLDSNPLLANNAKLKREWIKFIEEDDFPQEENYVACREIVNGEAYEGFHDPSRVTLITEKKTLLKSIQTDLLLMVPVKAKSSINETQSLQIHQVSTFQREVEVLYQNLVHLFENRSDIEPQDVAVYAPYPEKYISYLDFVFNQKESPIKISIYNVPFKTRNSPLKAFLLLIDLVCHRSSSDKLLELFHHKAFKEKFKIDSQMLELWEQWILEVGVSFGFDKKDQEEKLLREVHEEAFSSLPHWENLIESLLKFACQGDLENGNLKALNQVDFSEMESINLLSEILHSLKEDLTILSSKKETLVFWANYTTCLLQSYFQFEKDAQKEAQTILSKIALYQQLGESLQETYSFDSFLYYLKKDLDDLEKTSPSSTINCLSFYSLSNGPLVNSKVICILGLNDLEFPRTIEENPFNLLDSFKEKNYCPKLMDYDRYLFLELLLSAKDFFFLSYLGYCSETFREAKPSTLIDELLSYLDQRFVFKNHKISDLILHKHPHLSFSKQYFQHKNYDYDNFCLAKSYYNSLSKDPSEGIRDHFLKASDLQCHIHHKQSNREIPLSHLFALARNPIQFSLNQIHNIYLEQTTIAHENQNYSLSFLQKAIYKNQLLKGESIEREEGFPKGIFKELANEQLFNDEIEQDIFFKELELSKDDFFSIEFRQDVETAYEYKKGLWVAPKISVELSGSCYELVGILEPISKLGYLSQKEMTKSSFFAEWPKYLLYLLAKDILPLSFKENWIFCKSREVKELKLSQVSEFLKKYLEFYFLSLSHPLPFLPNWIPYFYKFSPDQISKKINQDLSSLYFHNTYAKILFNDCNPDKKACFRWKQLATELFEQTITALDEQ